MNDADTTLETTPSLAEATPRKEIEDEDETGTGTTTKATTEADTGTTTDSKVASCPFDGDGVDPSQAEALVPHGSLMDWVSYTVSLNYNRIATSPVLSPFTRWHWYDRIPHTSLILGAVPSAHQLVHMQRQDKVQDIVNMCAEFQGHIHTMKRLGLYQCWIPTRDFHTPSVASIWIGVRFIDKCEKNWKALPESDRGRIYLHCKAGRGRSATVAICWLVYRYKLTPAEAQRILLRARGQVDKNICLHPEVVSFCDQVKEEINHGLIRITWPGEL